MTSTLNLLSHLEKGVSGGFLLYCSQMYFGTWNVQALLLSPEFLQENMLWDVDSGDERLLCGLSGCSWWGLRLTLIQEAAARAAQCSFGTYYLVECRKQHCFGTYKAIPQNRLTSACNTYTFGIEIPICISHCLKRWWKVERNHIEARSWYRLLIQPSFAEYPFNAWLNPWNSSLSFLPPHIFDFKVHAADLQSDHEVRLNISTCSISHLSKTAQPLLSLVD